MKSRIALLLIGLALGFLLNQSGIIGLTINPPQARASAPDDIVFAGGSSCLDRDGHVWTFNPGSNVCWQRAPQYDPPMPVSEIKFWEGAMIIANDNVAWIIEPTGWKSCGSWPGGALPTDQSTWGKIKAKFSSKEGH